MSHRNARLTVRACLEMIIAVETGLTQAEIARQFRVSRATVQKYVRRFREQGETGLLDRSSRPRSSPRLTPARLVTKICSLRRKRSWGPHRIGWRLKMPHSTVYAVLKRMGISRLGWMHRTTREIVRYEHPSPGDMVHLDVKKLARVPDGGGKRFKPGFTETHSGPDSKRPLGYDYLHVAIDDHSRVVYIEVLPDEKGPTTAGFLERTLAFYSAKGMRVKRILTDNGGNYISHAFADMAQAHSVRLKRTRPFRPQTNGKAERFIRTLQQEWAYSRPFGSNQQRLNALPRFINYYNHRRPHGGIAGAVPASRL